MQAHAQPRSRLKHLAAAAAMFAALVGAHADDSAIALGSKAPYAPQQDPSTYEAPPSGFVPIYTETVARHGSRGLSSPSSDLATYNMWSAAQAAGALTKLGQRLGPDVMRITQANALLGYGVPGITAPGYGNLTQRGISEHQQLAVRLAARTQPLLTNAAAQAGSAPRQVIVSTSGVNRAIDSANFFTQSLAATVPGLAPLIVNSAPLTAYPVTAPVAQPAGVNRFDLYFHKLTAKTDLPAPTDPNYPIYQNSLQYQSYLSSDPTMIAKVNGIVYDDDSQAAARETLEQVFTPAFVDALANGQSSYANTGSYTFTSSDGKFTTTITGDGQTVLANPVDAANAIYAVYSITPAMVNEVPVNLAKYIPADALQTFGYLSDVEDFYQKGPGIAEAGTITYRMAQGLLDDFFVEADAIAAGNLAHAAKLRFTHAEIIMPFSTLLGLPNASVPVPEAQDYTYASNPWRGAQVAPLAGNVQWDLYRNIGGTVLVKMYVDEQETDFPAACESARYLQGTTSHYYEYQRLKACYGESDAPTRHHRLPR